uniref:HEAT repeat-containing protein n=1 Tax=Candidatus Kentrum sp. DK TaxID=2126562 RepID=A0A450SMN0_9GAMM|nr:MAG: HEAT repeat-containing protein [Candidatus Kentron sp. DK]
MAQNTNITGNKNRLTIVGGDLKVTVQSPPSSARNGQGDQHPEQSSRKPAGDATTMEYDVFISYASEDKGDVVLPLVDALRRRDITVWFDEFELMLGDSLRRKIDQGLTRSRYGVVILSPAFLAKEWTNRELDGLLVRERGGAKVILPVWHDLDAMDIAKYSPPLADRVAVSASMGVDYVAGEIFRIVCGTDVSFDKPPSEYKKSLPKRRPHFRELLFGLFPPVKSTSLESSSGGKQENSQGEKKGSRDTPTPPNHPRFALFLLQQLIRCQEDDLLSLSENLLTVRDKPIEISFSDWSGEEQKARLDFLCRRLGLVGADPESLGKVWKEALERFAESKSRLLEIGRRLIPNADKEKDRRTPWRRAMEACLYRVFPEPDAVERLTEEQRRQPDPPLELAPLLEDWPWHLLTHPSWAYTEAPLPDVPPLPLSEVWVDVQFIEPLEADLIPEDGFLNALERRYEENRWLAQPARFVIERLRGCTALVGAPGVGKTTLLKWLARYCVQQNDGRFLLPLFVSLRTYVLAAKREKLDIIAFALRQCGIHDPGQIRKWRDALRDLCGLGSNTVLFLLDGWDEVPHESREMLREEIRQLTYGFSILITSRPSAYPHTLPADQFFEITELSPSDIDLLARRWFRAIQAPEQEAEKLLAHLDAYPDLRRLARNPFLLSLLCGISRQGKKLPPPASRAALYRRTMDYIAAHHSRRYPAQPFDSNRQRQVERLALWLLAEAPEAPQYVFSEQEVWDCIHDEDFLPKVLQPSRLLSQWSMDHESLHFLHTTFHEYLAARGLLSTDPENITRQLQQHKHDIGWQEIFCFIAGARSEFSDVFWQTMRQMAMQPDRFGFVYVRLARFVAETGATDGGLALLGVDLRDRLWRLICQEDQLPPSQPFVDAYGQLDVAGYRARVQQAVETGTDKELRYRLRRTLGRIKSPDASKTLVDEILSGDIDTGAVAGYALQDTLDSAGFERLRGALDNPDLPLPTRENVIRALGYAHDYRVARRLSEIARHEEELRRSALKALGDMGGETAIRLLAEQLHRAGDSTAKSEIIDALGRMREPGARDCLLEALASCPPDDPLAEDILNALYEVPISQHSELIIGFLSPDKPESVRVAAAWALREAMEPVAFRALARAADNDPNEKVRIAALAALRERTGFEVPWLAARVRDETRNARERANALEALLVAVARQQGNLSGDGNLLHQEALALVRQTIEGRYPELTYAAASRAYLLGEAIAPRLMALCTDEAFPDGVRGAACASLGKLKYQPAATALLGLIARTPNVLEKGKEPPLPDIGQHPSRAAAEALVAIDPALALGRSEPVLHNALRAFAMNTGCLVFQNHIVDAAGKVIAERRAPDGPRLGTSWMRIPE